ncbi:MAG: CCA tRNA nucleotidyltransferase [Paludibacteraceae bacterium]|nr:CCA tRNA nucleotidyltransferase [Paludibacteraceae bacterium]
MNYKSELNANKVFPILSKTADNLGLECYVVGGWVRDLLLGRPSEDIDVVVVGSGIEMAEAFAKELGRGAYIAVFRNFGTAQVRKGKIDVEFVGARKESYHRESRKPIVEDGTLADDQCRRDFTVNAMAICLNSSRYGELVDPFNGVEDLQSGIIRTPLDPDITFSDDPLRMMRAIRFATRLGFSILSDTYGAIRRNVERMDIISSERTAEELNKIMRTATPSRGLMLMDGCGLLDKVLPEIAAMKGVQKYNERAHKDIFAHTLKVLQGVADRSDDLWLRYAALFHDVGKPKTKQWDETHGWIFYNHNFVGMKMLTPIFRRLHLPLGEELKFVKKMVDLHMRPINLCDEGVTDSAIRRLLFDAGDDIDKLMILCESDITSANREKVERFANNYQLLRLKLKEIEEKDRIRNFQPPVDGIEIMRMFNIPPCATIGELKTAVKDAILDGVIPNEHDAARDFVIARAAELNLKPAENLDSTIN